MQNGDLMEHQHIFVSQCLQRTGEAAAIQEKLLFQDGKRSRTWSIIIQQEIDFQW